MLTRKVLLLNQNYEPLTVVTAKKAIILIYMQKVEIVEQYDLVVRSCHTAIAVPSVVRLLYFVKVPFKRVELTRRNIMKRDRFRCQYCRSTRSLTIDHIVPKTKGGTDTWENLVCACVHCNNKKGDRTPDQARMKLIKKPKRPHHLYYIHCIVGVNEQSWKPYLFYYSS